jgi:preprotein translocase subunit SecF
MKNKNLVIGIVVAAVIIVLVLIFTSKGSEGGDLEGRFRFRAPTISAPIEINVQNNQEEEEEELQPFSSGIEDEEEMQPFSSGIEDEEDLQPFNSGGIQNTTAPTIFNFGN